MRIRGHRNSKTPCVLVLHQLINRLTRIIEEPRNHPFIVLDSMDTIGERDRLAVIPEGNTF
jgi:hypothetical protein